MYHSSMYLDVVNLPFCPDRIKKYYVIFNLHKMVNLDYGLPAYHNACLYRSWHCSPVHMLTHTVELEIHPTYTWVLVLLYGAHRELFHKAGSPTVHQRVSYFCKITTATGGGGGGGALPIKYSNKQWESECNRWYTVWQCCINHMLPHILG